MGITLEVFGLQHNVLHRMSVGSSKPPSKWVKSKSKLASSPGCLKFECLGMKPPIGSGKRYRRPIRMIGRGNLATVQATGNIHPAIQAQNRMAHTDLSGFVTIKAREYDFL